MAIVWPSMRQPRCCPLTGSPRPTHRSNATRDPCTWYHSYWGLLLRAPIPSNETSAALGVIHTVCSALLVSHTEASAVAGPFGGGLSGIRCTDLSIRNAPSYVAGARRIVEPDAAASSAACTLSPGPTSITTAGGGAASASRTCVVRAIAVVNCRIRLSLVITPRPSERIIAGRERDEDDVCPTRARRGL